MSGSTSYTLVLNDSNAPFNVTAAATTLDVTSASPASTTVTASKPGLGALTYSNTVPSPVLPPEVTFTFVNGTATLTRTAPGAGGSSTVDVTVADAGCGGTRHQGTVTLTLNY